MPGWPVAALGNFLGIRTGRKVSADSPMTLAKEASPVAFAVILCLQEFFSIGATGVRQDRSVMPRRPVAPLHIGHRINHRKKQERDMDIEVSVVGESSRWVLNQARIRIGRDPRCEVVLPAAQYPTVSGVHVELDVVNDGVRLASTGDSTGGGVFLNGNPAGDGYAVRSGDVLRLGSAGPELRVRIVDRVARTTNENHEPTRVMQTPGQTTHEPTRVLSGPGQTTVMQTPAAAPGGGGRYGYGTDSLRGTPTPAPSAAPPTPPPAPAPPPARAAAESESLRVSLLDMETRLKGMRILLIANLAILLALLLWIFQMGQQLSATRQELRELHTQAQTAVGQFQPELDSRLSTFEKRMDGIDVKMKAAQDQMVSGMDAKMKSVEDRLVERMNTEIPAMLDKYVNRKLGEVKH
jgi:hypothetical protein